MLLRSHVTPMISVACQSSYLASCYLALLANITTISVCLANLCHPTMSENAAAEPVPIQDKSHEAKAEGEPVLMKKPARKSERKQQQRKQLQRSQQRQRQMLTSKSAKQRRTRSTAKKREGEEPKKTESFAEKANKWKQQDKQANDGEDSNEAQDKEEGSAQNRDLAKARKWKRLQGQDAILTGDDEQSQVAG